MISCFDTDSALEANVAFIIITSAPRALVKKFKEEILSVE